VTRILLKFLGRPFPAPIAFWNHETGLYADQILDTWTLGTGMAREDLWVVGDEMEDAVDTEQYFAGHHLSAGHRGSRLGLYDGR
jgi:hypothetical protein